MANQQKHGRKEGAADLLSALQAEVEAAAAAEVAQLAAARQARIDAEVAALQRDEAQRAAAVEARIEAERRRQALRAAALMPAPAPKLATVPPTPERTAAPGFAAPLAPRELPSRRRARMAPLAIAIALPLLCVSAVVGALVYQQHRDRPQAATLAAPTAPAFDARRAYPVVLPVETLAAMAAPPAIVPVAAPAEPAVAKPAPRTRRVVKPPPTPTPTPPARLDLGDLSDLTTAE